MRNFVQYNTPKTQNQELRFSGDAIRRLHWQAGAFYFEENNAINSYNAVPTAWSSLTPVNEFRYGVTTRSLGVYTQLEYKILKSLVLSGGFRYSFDGKERTGDSYVANTSTTPYTYQAIAQNKSGYWQKPTFHLGLNWDVTKHNMAYVKFDTGYKSGGFTDVNVYGPESIKAYELGFKNRFFNNTVQFNVAGFYSDYTNQQVSQSVPSIYGTSQVTVNAGSSPIYGVEPSLTVRIPVVGLFEANTQWLHAKYNNFTTAISGVNTNLSGNWLPQSPQFSGGFALMHTFELPHGGLSARVDTKIQSGSYYEYYNYPLDHQRAYTVSNLMLTYRPYHGHWWVQGYIRNMENSMVYSYASVVSSG